MLIALIIISALIVISMAIFTFDKKILFVPIVFFITIISFIIGRYVMDYNNFLGYVVIALGITTSTILVVRKIRKNRRDK
jgi:hypothetical protein